MSSEPLKVLVLIKNLVNVRLDKINAYMVDL